jgi:SAM-dependent MidA family methyltransferase
MQLSDIIIKRILQDGTITFRDFMDISLYYPGLGYYVSDREKLGAEGDFYTSCSLTPAFGGAIANQLEEMWHILGCPAVFRIVEFGAGMGLLCRDIMLQLKVKGDIYDCLRYCIIEKSPFLKKKEAEILLEKVSWHNCLSEIRGNIDCILSNELLDNFPVHLVQMQERLMEVHVGYNGVFMEQMEPAPDTLINYFEGLGLKLPVGYRAEVNLEAIDWLEEVANYLNRGFIITIDYGGDSEELYKPHRKEGTLVSYSKHKVTTDIYSNIGGQDITAHINFSALKYWGERFGLTTCGYTPQAFFLLALDFRVLLEKHMLEKADKSEAIRQMAMINHILLFEMGHKYKVLVQSKGVSAPRLSGFKLQEPFLQH